MKIVDEVKVTEGAMETTFNHVIEMVRCAVELVPNESERQTLLKAVQ